MDNLNTVIDLQEFQKKKDIELATHIYKDAEATIVYQIKIGAQACYYKLPEFIWGFPLIDPHTAMPLLIEQLQDNGFVIQQTQQPRTLLITWSLAEIAAKLKEKPSKISLSSSQSKTKENSDIFDIIVRKKIKKF